MIRLKIDGRVVPLSGDITLPKSLFNYDAASMHDVESSRNGESLELEIPLSEVAAQVFQPTEECSPAPRFNAEYHEGVVEVDGVEIIRGVVHLLAIRSDEQRIASYHIVIRRGGSNWAEKAAVTDIEATKIDYDVTLSGEQIVQSWASDSAVKFLPVHYDSYDPEEPHLPFRPTERFLSTDDYYPFISVEKLLRAIFGDAGYSIESRWLESHEARALHISGAYSERRATSLAHLNMIAGFTAGRSATVSAEASEIGIVYVTPAVAHYSVGNFVDTCDGELYEGLYDNNSTLTIDQSGITFTPPVAMTVGFDFYVKYTTPYRIISRDRLRSFNRVCIEPGCEMTLPLANPFEDVRGRITPSIEYMVCLFDYEVEQSYRFCWQTTDTTYAWQSMSGNTLRLKAPNTTRTITGRVEQLVDGEWHPYTGDWALYEGFVKEVGTTEVEVTLSMAPEALSPDKAKCFDKMYISGGEPGWELTLHEECCLRPRFTSSPAIGSKLNFASVAQHDVKQIELVKAVAQMYNLCILSDQRRKRVYIEPYDDMFSAKVIDWRERIDRSRGFERRDMAQQVAQIRRLSYRSGGGGAVERYNNREDTTLGVWSAKSDSYIARQRVENNQNALFCPTLTSTGIILRAPSAGFLSMGDRDGDALEEHSIRIVRYEGLVPLPKGESWGFPGGGGNYPFAAFHFPYARTAANAAMEGDVAISGTREGFTLCFEERDNQTGLNSHYRKMFRRQSLSEKITLAVRMTPQQMVDLFDLRCEENICSTFRLSLGAESVLCHIDAIEAYDAESYTATIRFARCLSDEAEV